MKKGINLFAILIGLLLLVVVAIGVILLCKGSKITKSNKSSSDASQIKNEEIFDIKDKSDLKTFAKKNKNEVVFEENYGYLYSVNALGYPADFDCQFDGDKIESMSVQIPLYDLEYPVSEETSEQEDIDMEYVSHEYTKEEKVQAKRLFDELKFSFEEYLQCGELPRCNYVTINPNDTVDTSSMTEEEQFYKGYKMAEYSVRDKDGVLWLLRLYAWDYSGSASIIKVIDISEYNGFVPIIDMKEEK